MAYEYQYPQYVWQVGEYLFIARFPEEALAMYSFQTKDPVMSTETPEKIQSDELTVAFLERPLRQPTAIWAGKGQDDNVLAKRTSAINPLVGIKHTWWTAVKRVDSREYGAWTDKLKEDPAWAKLGWIWK